MRVPSGWSPRSPLPGADCARSRRRTVRQPNAVAEREKATRSSQKRSAAIAILDARRMRFEHEPTPIRIDEGMALTPVDLFPGIVAARPASLGRLAALAVDDRTRGTGFGAHPLAPARDHGAG